IVSRQDRARAGLARHPALVHHQVGWLAVPHPAAVLVVLRFGAVARPPVDEPFPPVRALHHEAPPVVRRAAEDLPAGEAPEPPGIPHRARRRVPECGQRAGGLPAVDEIIEELFRVLVVEYVDALLARRRPARVVLRRALRFAVRDGAQHNPRWPLPLDAFFPDRRGLVEEHHRLVPPRRAGPLAAGSLLAVSGIAPEAAPDGVRRQEQEAAGRHLARSLRHEILATVDAYRDE